MDNEDRMVESLQATLSAERIKRQTFQNRAEAAEARLAKSIELVEKLEAELTELKAKVPGSYEDSLKHIEQIVKW